MISIRRLLPPRPAVPGLRVLRPLRRAARGDLIAGVAVGAYLVPQCLAYARLAGVDAVSALWAAMAALLVYALLGTSSLLSVGPESASALLVGAAVATLTRSGDVDPAAAASALAIAVAVITLIAWAVRLGFLADLLSKPVLVGYLAGVAISMVVSQLPNITGIRSEHRDALPRIRDIASGLGDLEAAPLILGAAVVVAMAALQRFRRIPGPLVVVLVATAANSWFDLGVATVGTVPGGIPSVAFPSIPAHVWPGVFGAALGVALVAFSGNILTGRAFARHSGDRIDANQELLALAGANAGAGLVGGFPVSSSDSRTALAEAANGKSQLTSVVAAAFVALALLVARPLLEAIPLAALGGLVIYAGARLVDVQEMRRIYAFRPSEALIAGVACAGVVVFDLLVGIGVAVALSVGDLFRRIARGHDAVQGIVPGLAGMHDVDDYPSAETIPGLVVYRFDAPLCFANAEFFRTRVLAAVDEEPNHVEWLVLNVEANVEIDLTATDMLSELREEVASRGTVLALARVKRDLEAYLERVGLIDRIGREHVFPTLPTAVEAFRSQHRHGRSD